MSDDERWQGIAVYAIYIVGLFTALPLLIGLVLAYLFRSGASPAAKTHYEHQIGLFWRFVLGNIVVGFLVGIGWFLTMTVVLGIIGIPLLILCGVIFVWLWVMLLTRSLRGIGRLNQAEAYPIPAGFSL
jgi:uncharacterized membrane protein